MAVRRDGTQGRSPATNLPVGRNSTVIPNNYLQLGREARRILAYGRETHTRSCAGSRPTVVGRYLTRSSERGTHPSFEPAVSPAGRSVLIRHRSLAHRHVHASLGAQSSSEISVIPSNDFSPFVPSEPRRSVPVHWVPTWLVVPENSLRCHPRRPSRLRSSRGSTVTNLRSLFGKTDRHVNFRGYTKASVRRLSTLYTV